ncbi:MAG: hypothetical protein JST92_05970 [Deltaproteobacteria bacterium]|nr:hypothetical protein [Deltaproteobacteria bacterium]
MRHPLQLAIVSLSCALALTAPALAGDPKSACPAYPFPHARRTITVDQVTATVKKAIANAWPQLAPYDIRVVTFKSDQDYFKSETKVSTIELNAKKRTYHVMVNEKLLADAPSDAALYAIAVHELSHINDYRQMTSVQFIAWAAKYAVESQATYERQTDGAPLSRKLGCGLMEYRVWLYAHVDAKTLALKRKNYFTPEEIADWMAKHK